MAEFGVDVAGLPEKVREKLAELQLELSEADITEKGYRKKCMQLLGPYIDQQKLLHAHPVTPAQTAQPANSATPASATGRSSPSASQRRIRRRLTKNDNRHYSEIRIDHVKRALEQCKGNTSQNVPVTAMKRRAKGQSHSQKDPKRHTTDSSSDDESVSDAGSRSGANKSAVTQGNVVSVQVPAQPPPPQPTQVENLATANQQRTANSAQPLLSPVARVPSSVPPDVTTSHRTPEEDSARLRFHGHPHLSSVRGYQGLDPSVPGDRAHGKVSAKIQQLLNTLKRPKRKPLNEFFEDDLEAHINMPNAVDPSAPRPERSPIVPLEGEPLTLPTGLAKNLEAALQRYAAQSAKCPVFTVLDQSARPSTSITYAKFYQQCQRIAYTLLKLGPKGASYVQRGDRVALVFPNNDPLGFAAAFYGCLLANAVPVPVEVPLSKRDADTKSVGFVLLALQVCVILTSDACYKGLPKNANGSVAFDGWPRVLHWMVTDSLSKPSKDWQPQCAHAEADPAYIEHTMDKDGTVMGVTITRSGLLSHCRTLTVACSIKESETAVCVLDFKRDAGLWHGILNSIYNGMHVIFVPYAVMKGDPASWMKMVTKYKASIALVKSRDMYWGLQATRDHKDISLESLRLLLIADGANPWSLTSCEQFYKTFQTKGLKPEAICPLASSSQALTVALRRPGINNSSASVRGVLSIRALSYGVVRAEQEGDMNSMTLQDVGQVLPGATMVVVKVSDEPDFCKADEVGEICISASYCGTEYWKLVGKSKATFQAHPISPGGRTMDKPFVRTGLLGFFHKGQDQSCDLVFVCGTKDGLMVVSGRKHNMDDIIATVLAVEPLKFVYRGRIAVFSVQVLKDQRVVVVAEQRPSATEEESFQWMSRVLQAVEGIHEVNIYCLVLVQSNDLPKTPLGGIHLQETKRRFLAGELHPSNILMCPHTCITNLPKPREIHSHEVGPSAMHVGAIVQGSRIAWAQGRDCGVNDEDGDAGKFNFLHQILRWRADHSPGHELFTVVNSRTPQQSVSLTCKELHQRAERIACQIIDKAKATVGSPVALLFQAGLDLICGFYGCLYAGVVPICIRPPHQHNLRTTLPTVRMILETSQAGAVLMTSSTARLMKGKEVAGIVSGYTWPTFIVTDDPPRRKKNLSSIFQPPTPDCICYLDFSVSTTGMLAGVKVSHRTVAAVCRSIKLQCEFYMSREVVLSLEPFSGLGFVLWCLSGIYAGYHSILVPPAEVELSPSIWINTVSQYKVRDTYCSYGVVELSTRATTSTLLKGADLTCVRSCVIVAEERPRDQITSLFCKVFAELGLNPRAISTSFGCRSNVAICLQGASCPEPSHVYVDMKALRYDRVAVVEKGSPSSLCLTECGKLLPGVTAVIANPETKGPCADSHLGEIWVHSQHNSNGYFTIYGDQLLHADHFNAHLEVGDTQTTYARTGYLGFVRRTELKQADGEQHDALFVVGSLEETIMLRGLRYHPFDIELSVLRCHRRILECAVFIWYNLLVVVVELNGPESEALDLIPLITKAVVEDHHLVVGVVVVVDLGVIPINSRGEKQRMHLRDGFLADQLDPIYVAYNM